jgi:hypothetical protein
MDYGLPALVDWIRSNKVMVSRWCPTIGYKGPAEPVYMAMAVGDRLVWDRAGSVVAVNFAWTRDSFRLDGGDWTVELDDVVPPTAAVFRAPQTPEEENAVQMHVDAAEDNRDEIVKLMKETLAAHSYKSVRTPKVRFQWARWTVLDLAGLALPTETDGYLPAGVVTQTEFGRGFLFTPFPGYESKAAALSGDWGPPDGDPWLDLQDRVGRNNNLCDPEYIIAFDHQDAAKRAYYKFAEDCLNGTGRRVIV